MQSFTKIISEIMDVIVSMSTYRTNYTLFVSCTDLRGCQRVAKCRWHTIPNLIWYIVLNIDFNPPNQCFLLILSFGIDILPVAYQGGTLGAAGPGRHFKGGGTSLTKN